MWASSELVEGRGGGDETVTGGAIRIRWLSSVDAVDGPDGLRAG
jgi:hypothetical protein